MHKNREGLRYCITPISVRVSASLDPGRGIRASSQCNSAELTSPVNMSYNCCSGNFSSRSCGGYLGYPGSSCGSPYPSNLVYSTDLCSPRASQLGSSLYRGCQEPCWEPTSCQTSCVKSSPCQTSCF
ncbi:Keratin-associated protein 13-1 [Plecturocebus cupreus]